MLFTLTVQNKIYSVVGVTHRDKTVLRTAINKGKATQLNYYLFDGSLIYEYNVLFSKVITAHDLQYILAESVSTKQINTTTSCKTSLVKQGSLMLNQYCIFSHKLNHLYVTSIVKDARGVTLFLADKEVLRISLLSTVQDLYTNTNLVQLTRSTNLTIDSVALQILVGNIKLDGTIHYLSENHIDSYGIKYEVSVL